MGSMLARVPEPEIMVYEEEMEYIRYNSIILRNRHPLVSLFADLCPGFPGSSSVRALDIGCGVANMSVEFAKTYPELKVVGVDASENMLRHAYALTKALGYDDRVSVRYARVPEDDFGEPDSSFDLVFTRSTLHQFADPECFWETVRRYAKPDAAVFIVDLLRPYDLASLEAFVWQRFGDKFGSLRSTFTSSLLASYTENEMVSQLVEAGLDGFEVSAFPEGTHATIWRHGRFGGVCT